MRRTALLTVLCGLAGPAAPLASANAQIHRVGPGETLSTIGEAVEAAGAGDTVWVAAGTYHERLEIERPLTLVGEGWPVLDGGGIGHVIEARANLHLEGLVIRGSGTSVDEEHAGVLVADASAHIEGNWFEDVFYGIYLKNAPNSVIRGNRIEGKPFAPPRRGDGIRLWYSSGTRIEDNEVVGTRDVVVYFSDSLRVVDNVIRDGRYGLHYMYSNHNVFERNRFSGNQVGAFIMYSADILLRDNVFAESEGASGMGLGLKDADQIVARDNLFLANESGIYLDNSPRSRDERNRFVDNLLLGNAQGVRLMPSVRDNDFSGNEFIGNQTPVVVAGGAGPGQAELNRWRENHWGPYAGFDRNGDGQGDTPFTQARFADDLLTRRPELQVFARSPTLGVLEVVSRFFPLLRPEAIAVDSGPRVSSVQLARWREDPPVALAGPGLESGRQRPSLSALILWSTLLLAAAVFLWRSIRRGRS